MKIVNLTPHEINIFRSMEDIVPMMSIPPSGIVARVSTISELYGEIDGVPIFSFSFGDIVELYGEIDGVPIFSFSFGDIVDILNQESGTIYIVSAMLLEHKSMKNRKDVFAPGELKRNEKGQPIGCIGLRC
jgi:hypothetical protein